MSEEKHKLVVISGGFDPLHKGHIHYISAAKTLAGRFGHLLVGLNSDEWLRRKKGSEFLGFEDRNCIVTALGDVDWCWMFDDSDDTAIDIIKQGMEMAELSFPDHEVVFANGGDRSSASETPESDFCKQNGIECFYGVGGTDKVNSSSWILKKWNDK